MMLQLVKQKDLTLCNLKFLLFMKNFQEMQNKTEADILLFLLPHTETQEKTKGIFFGLSEERKKVV